MEEGTKRQIKDTIYCLPGAYLGSAEGFQLASSIVPEYITRHFSEEGGNILRQVAYKFSEASITTIERNPNYDIISWGIASACCIAGALLSVWGLRKVEKYVMNKINEKYKVGLLC